MSFPNNVDTSHTPTLNEIFEILTSELDHTGSDYRVFRNFVEKINNQIINISVLFHVLESSPKTPNNLVLLGAFYDLGIGTKEDKKKALALYEEAANDHNPRGLYLAASAYTIPNYGEINDYKAFHFYDKSARTGYSRAKLSVADCHGYGLGTNIHARKCFYWDQECTKDEIYETFGMMAHHYLTGYGTEIDVHAAMRWYRRALKSSPDTVTSQLCELFRIPYFQ